MFDSVYLGLYIRQFRGWSQVQGTLFTLAPFLTIQISERCPEVVDLRSSDEESPIAVQ